MNEMSGSRFLFSGVGTQMITASTSFTRLKSAEAENRPAFTCSASAGGFDVLDVTLPRVERVDFGLVNVQSQHGDAGTRELERQRQADVTETDDGDFHGCGGGCSNGQTGKRPGQRSERSSGWQDLIGQPAMEFAVQKKS